MTSVVLLPLLFMLLYGTRRDGYSIGTVSYRIEIHFSKKKYRFLGLISMEESTTVPGVYIGDS